jgi:hypothetical protein
MKMILMDMLRTSIRIIFIDAWQTKLKGISVGYYYIKSS